MDFMSSAPGRADLFNTHQDYKGLPVVSAALDMRVRVYGSRTEGGMARVFSRELHQEDEFRLPRVGERVELLGGGWFGDYLRSTSQAVLSGRLHDEGVGLIAEVRSEVPVSAGLASSGALEVAFASFLNRVFSLGLNRRQIAELAFRAERDVMGIPCGRLDQYGSALGGLTVIFNHPPYRSKSYGTWGLTFAVVDSGLPHSTASVHQSRQAEMRSALDELREAGLDLGRDLASARWDLLTEEGLLPLMPSLSETSRKRLTFTVRMQRSTEEALAVLGRGRNESAVAELGRIMDLQHELLRDYYDVSLPSIEAIRESMKRAGALGVKLSGAGMGGSLVGLVEGPEQGRRAVAEAVASGAKDGWVKQVGGGELSRERALRDQLRSSERF
ncbi:MAG: galactokinase family protein [TACK group archaeon]|nr:galactokinase family protein [TACK group archaeon]